MIFYNSDNLVQLDLLYGVQSGAYQETATVNGYLFNGVSQIYTFALTYVTGSAGRYQGVIPYTETAGLTLGNTYTLRVIASTSGGGQFADSQDHVCQYYSG